MTKDELFGQMEMNFLNCIELAKKKNADYADTEDALSNFREWGSFGTVVRLGDKYNRIKNIYKNGKEIVESESVDDTLRDMINYCNICLILRGYEQINEAYDLAAARSKIDRIREANEKFSRANKVWKNNE